jgi:hypothetical protein
MSGGIMNHVLVILPWLGLAVFIAIDYWLAKILLKARLVNSFTIVYMGSLLSLWAVLNTVTLSMLLSSLADAGR